MFSNILVPLDGSRVGEAALPYAQALAERTGACLTLLRAASASPTLANIARRQKRAVDEAESYLNRTATRLRAQGLTVETAVPYGLVAPSIANEITSGNTDLLVMATHDPTGTQRWARGSIAEMVIRHVNVPVLIIRAASRPQLAERLQEECPLLIVALDGSELAEAALPVASDLAQRLHGQLVLLGVIPRIGQRLPVRRGAPPSLAEQDFRQVLQEAHAYLATKAGHMGGQVKVATAVRSGDPAGEINREAEERYAAAIVMATHGRTGVARALLGSVAGQVVHSGSTPVLLVHPVESSARGRRGPRRIGWGIPLERVQKHSSPEVARLDQAVQ